MEVVAPVTIAILLCGALALGYVLGRRDRAPLCCDCGKDLADVSRVLYRDDKVRCWSCHEHKMNGRPRVTKSQNA